MDYRKALIDRLSRTPMTATEQADAFAAAFMARWLTPHDYVAANLQSLLKALPEANTGDWYGQLLNWCEEVLKDSPDRAPNKEGREIRKAVVEKDKIPLLVR